MILILDSEELHSEKQTTITRQNKTTTQNESLPYQPETGDEPPRAIKKRTKKIRTDRRSKSVEHRRKRQIPLHNSISKSKDDLDFGTYTVIGRPSNPWD